MNKTFIYIGGLVLIVGAMIYLSDGVEMIEPPLQVGVIHPLDNIKGVASSTVVLMEYSDFQCPACRSYYPILREVMAEYGDKITFVYRHFPLISIHPNAEFAARAAEAAHKQGKFWEMHDLLFEKQNEWAKVANVAPIFESYATLLGLSVDQFKADYISDEVKKLVRAHRVHATKSGLSSTPTFFLNGQKIENPTSVYAFKQLIQAELAK